jgi:hypothetical protein
MKSFFYIVLILISTNTFAGEFDFQLSSEGSEVTGAPPFATPQEPIVLEIPSGPNESQVVVSFEDPWRVGFQTSGLGALSTVDYQDGYSGGLGWSIALQAEKYLGPNVRFLGSIGYQSLSVGRFLGSTTTTIDDPFSLYVQTQKGPFVQGMVGVPLMAGHFDFGIEYFHPTSAEQMVGDGGGLSNYDFTPSKFLFVVAGPSMTWKVRGDWELEAHAWVFVNTVGESKFRLMGSRLGLALRAPL